MSKLMIQSEANKNYNKIKNQTMLHLHDEQNNATLEEQ